MHLTDRIDHVLPTSADVAISTRFYVEVKQTLADVSGDRRTSLGSCSQRSDLHRQGAQVEPKAQRRVPDALDICFIASVPPDDVITYEQPREWSTVEGPLDCTGSKQKISSIYVRNPGLKQIEVSEPMG